MILNIENPKDSTKRNLLKPMTLARLQGTRSFTKISYVLYTRNEQSESEIKKILATTG